MLNEKFPSKQRIPINMIQKKAIPDKFPCCQVEKGGNFKLNKRDENENIQYYAGSENQIRMTR